MKFSSLIEIYFRKCPFRYTRDIHFIGYIRYKEEHTAMPLGKL